MLRLGLMAVIASAVLGSVIACSGPIRHSDPVPVSARPGLPTSRTQRWRADIAYLARKLPAVRVGGLGKVKLAAWTAAAARLEAQVPSLTDDQIVVGMARMVAMLHDDETLLEFPAAGMFDFDAEHFGDGWYILAADDRALLGVRLLAVDGRPIAQVMVRAGTVIDAEDPQLRRNSEAGVLDDAALLKALGITDSATSAALTVRTTDGRKKTVRLTASYSGFIAWPHVFIYQQPDAVHVPLALYEHDAARPYWMRILPAEHVVYLRYSQCLSGNGFQQLAARALTQLRKYPDYRLIVDLRDNGGGDEGPILPLSAALRADPRLTVRGRVIGLVNGFTDSSATLDAEQLKEAGAVLIGQRPADPIDRWGNEETLSLPHSGIVIQYTTSVVNGSGKPLGLPDVVVEPTLAQTLAGRDPGLAAALSYRS